MSGQTSARMIEAIKLMLDGVTAYTAAQRAGVYIRSMYRNKYYLKIRDSGGDPKILADVRREIDVTRPLPRKDNKREKFTKRNT